MQGQIFTPLCFMLYFTKLFRKCAGTRTCKQHIHVGVHMHKLSPINALVQAHTFTHVSECSIKSNPAIFATKSLNLSKMLIWQRPELACVLLLLLCASLDHRIADRPLDLEALNRTCVW
jgi:hypothetical protein